MNKQLIEELQGATSILVLPHVKPDGDAFGSSLAFCHAMKTLGKDVVIHATEELPNYLSFLSSDLLVVEKPEDCEFDLQVILDSADLTRVQDRYQKGLKTIVIDHHITNVGFGDINWIDSEASSTGEMIYKLICFLNIPLTQQIMEALYAAIVLDTGRFYYSSTSSSTHRIVADFLSRGLDAGCINFKIYGEESLDKKRLFAKAIDLLESYYHGAYRVVHLPREYTEDMEPGDTEGLVESIRDIKGTEVALLVYYYDGQWKVSLRSKGAVDVSEIASAHGGGGHAQAAGFTVQGNLPQLLNTLHQQLGELLL